MFARYYGRRSHTTASPSSSLPTSPDLSAASSNGPSARQNQRRTLSSSNEANNATVEASKMLEELRTVLDKLDHLWVKIAPPPVATPLISASPPQSQSLPPSQSQTEEEDKNANELDDSDGVGDSTKYIGNAAVLVDNNQEGGIHNADDDESDCSVRTDTDNYDTTKNNCSVKNEDGNDHVDEGPSPRLSTSTASSASAASAAPTPQMTPPSQSTTSPIIPTRSAKFLDIHPTDINDIIECLRRSAEIVALSERRAGALEEELAAVLESSRLRRKDRRKNREINDNDASNKADADGEVHIPDKLDNIDDDDMNSKSQSTTGDDNLKQQNEELNGEDEDADDDEKKTEEDNYVDDAARLLPHHIASFELFCERNVLSKIVGLVTGSAFDNPSYTPTPHLLPRPQPQSRQQNLQSSPLPSTQPPPPLPPSLLLPPLSIATQAVQSASILIQNVCRATSLYLLLSNNVVNDLIGLPLDAYKRACAAEEADADAKDVAAAAAAAVVTTTGRKWGQQLHHLQQQQQQHQLLQQQQQQQRRHRQQRHQQEISELTTHFVSFLKGLAMRVNAETLQFFLSFPITTSTTMTTKDEKDRSGEKEVEFPLYARALEFCSPLVLMPTSSSTPSSSSGGEEDGNHHLDDPFVRITAMSVCMNILRLVTYHHIDVDDDIESVVDDNDDDDITNDDQDEEAAHACSDDNSDNAEVEDDDSIRQMEDNVNERREERKHKKQKQRRQHRDRQRNTSLPTSTPTGLLHKNPPVLPLQDRIAIAEYACHPTRVSDLISPLCVRLTTQFGQVEGMVRMLEEWDKDNSSIEGDNDAIDDSASTSSTTEAVATTTDTKLSAPSYKILSTTATTASRDVNEQEERKKQQQIHIRKQRRAAERARLCSAMQNLVANVQDELLLLDDFLKVGLISLNEQVIEMLLATFVYPMLLQPLLLPIHRYSSSPEKDMDATVQQGKDVEVENDNDPNVALEEKNLSAIITLQSSAPFSSILCSTTLSADGDATTTTANSNSTRKPQQDLAPAKTALYGLSLVIRTISNQTFRHLLLVALLHPHSPRASGGRPVVRSRPQITLRRGSRSGSKPRRKKKEKIKGVSSNSRDDSLGEIRTDANQERQSTECGELLQQDVDVYSFGTEGSNENDVDDKSANTNSFILAPSLVDILRHSCANQQIPSGDEATEETLSSGATMTRPNPYRHVLLSSISGSAEMAALQPLATALIHAAVSTAGSSTIQRIMLPMKDGDKCTTPSSIVTTIADGSSIGSDSEEETLKCLCLSIVNTIVTFDGWWKVKFNTVAARTLMDVISNKPVYISFAKDLVGTIRHDAAKFLMAIPSQLDARSREGEAENTDATQASERRPSALVDKQYLDNWLIDRFFFDRAGKSTISVVENVCYLKECCEEDDALEERYRYGLEVLTAMSLTEACALLCESTTVVATESAVNTSFHCAASWALACLYLDAFHGKLKKMLCSVIDNNDESGGQQHALLRRRLSYISPNRSRNDDDSLQEEEAISSSLAHISSKFTIAMLDECESPSSSGRNNSESSNDSSSIATPPEYGSAVGLVGRAAFPCVIELTSPASSSLFTGRTCISNEGIRWQSLYLVVLGKWAVFAEPGSDGTSAAVGEGRVVASCKLACLSFRRDGSSAANDKTNSARRLLVSHTSLDPRPPPLFVVDSSAASAIPRGGGRGGGGSILVPNGLRLTRSRMDLWFEDYHAGERARKVLSAKIAKARARRGERLSAALFTS